MFEKEIPVLLVDDDPDVIMVSRLAMRSFEVFGLPVITYSASNKADAIDLIRSRFALHNQVGTKLTVAFIDVVMETDTAGLDLCDYIRDTVGNKFTQLYIRTGQPGVAPERAVIDLHDINGYFTKMETTEDKLYSLVKSGARQAYFAGLSMSLASMLEALIAVADSRDMMAATLLRRAGIWDSGFKFGYMLADRSIARGMDEAALAGLRDRLRAGEAKPIGQDGDSYVVDGDQLLIHIAEGPHTAEVFDIAVGHAPAPAMLMPVMHTFARSFASLWKRGGA
jgi:CheY-like chemotaxis protein